MKANFRKTGREAHDPPARRADPTPAERKYGANFRAPSQYGNLRRGGERGFLEQKTWG